MDELEQTMTRYLLGELPEGELAALEEKYFTDPQLFQRVVQAEHELVDHYARGRLSPTARARFEQHYLAHPRRRERAKFAEALATKLDQLEGAEASAASRTAAGSWRRRLLAIWPARRRRLALSAALAALLVMLGGFWLIGANRRLRGELRETQAQRSRQEQLQRELEQRDRESQQRRRELEQQVADERARAEHLASELERLRSQPPGLQPKPAPPAGAAPAFVSLLLTVGGVRGAETGAPATLIIPPGTAQVRLRLGLKEHHYPSYQAVLQAVGGPEIFSRQGLKPRTASRGAGLVLVVPSDKFATGEYILTLRGRSQDGELDDVSKSIIRIEKR